METMEIGIGLAIGFLLGGGIVWLLARSRARQAEERLKGESAAAMAAADPHSAWQPPSAPDTPIFSLITWPIRPAAHRPSTKTLAALEPASSA